MSWLTGSMAVLGATPAGITIYLIVGVAGPQYVLSRRLDDPLRLGVAAFAAVGALLALGWGALGDGLHGETGVGLTAILAVVVFGVLGGAVVREFRAATEERRRSAESIPFSDPLDSAELWRK